MGDGLFWCARWADVLAWSSNFGENLNLFNYSIEILLRGGIMGLLIWGLHYFAEKFC